MLTLRSSSVEDTRAVAGALADLARPGDLVVLSGDLGAGKTAFCGGLAAGLGVVGPVTSPTFALHRRYAGSLLAFEHFDVYRLSGPDEADDLALDEVLEHGGVVAIEWGERIAPVLPADRLDVSIRWGDAEDERRIELRWGTAWADRAEALAAALEPWRTNGTEHRDPAGTGRC
ncbi:MAG: tRNA (adenosine(37)-N6)-threonylcarbamoyltransferase complex ATPase subunit type 1 TsaE [Acidimicrobiia bacterium]|nr:tRNA (adenosine(37)-N6)-threonylcarbamoyltransferase complex ATPase subunit type 1 TsaE [Acidimicrobiia bacterium]